MTQIRPKTHFYFFFYRKHPAHHCRLKNFCKTKHKLHHLAVCSPGNNRLKVPNFFYNINTIIGGLSYKPDMPCSSKTAQPQAHLIYKWPSLTLSCHIMWTQNLCLGICGSRSFEQLFRNYFSSRHRKMSSRSSVRDGALHLSTTGTDHLITVIGW